MFIDIFCGIREKYEEIKQQFFVGKQTDEITTTLFFFFYLENNVYRVL